MRSCRCSSLPSAGTKKPSGQDDTRAVQLSRRSNKAASTCNYGRKYTWEGFYRGAVCANFDFQLENKNGSRFGSRYGWRTERPEYYQIITKCLCPSGWRELRWTEREGSMQSIEIYDHRRSWKRSRSFSNSCDSVNYRVVKQVGRCQQRPVSDSAE